MIYPVLIISYLLGAVPFGYILTKVIKKVDIRRYGSGNIGATNVLRLLGWRVALPVFLLDAAKGAGAVFIARAFGGQDSVQLAAALAALIGHSFPVFLGFRGGKGAATGLGALLPLGGWVTPILLLIAGTVIAVTRYVSLGSILGALSLPLLFYLFGFGPYYIYFGAAMALLVILRHHANIARLLNGTESKLGQKTAPPEEGKD
ncbi:MAG TPA: glycerol-3-phosphate 1-O-acyltransferase PlsY [Bacillota bacterium]|mgnify:CR=1 FL=1|nr:glycerol-3-phosphate 1-O-acyltransferase PlsY [Bacillota bacterium]